MKQIQVLLPRASAISGRPRTVRFEVHTVGCDDSHEIAIRIENSLKEMFHEDNNREGPKNTYDDLESALRGLGEFGDGEDKQPWKVTVNCKEKTITVVETLGGYINGSGPRASIKEVFIKVAARIFK